MGKQGDCHVPPCHQAAPGQAQPGELPCLALANACPGQPQGETTFLGTLMRLLVASLTAAVPACHCPQHGQRHVCSKRL